MHLKYDAGISYCGWLGRIGCRCCDIIGVWLPVTRRISGLNKVLPIRGRTHLDDNGGRWRCQTCWSFHYYECIDQPKSSLLIFIKIADLIIIINGRALFPGPNWGLVSVVWRPRRPPAHGLILLLIFTLESNREGGRGVFPMKNVMFSWP